MQRRIVLAIAVFGVFLFTVGVTHAMTSTNYDLSWDSINSGGEDTSTSTNYSLRDTVGEQATGFVTSTNYGLRGGYRTGDMDLPMLSFSIHTQNNATQTPYIFFENATKTVSVVDPSFFSVGDMIGVVEHQGLSEKPAIGKITSITGSLITVDRWGGDNGAMVISPSGDPSYVYRMDSTAINFGTLTGPDSAAAITGTRVTTNAAGGFTVYVQSNGPLTNGSIGITDVSDHIVSAGSEEYGFHMEGTTATSTIFDYPFTLATRAIQYATGPVSSESACLIYKLSVLSSSPAGTFTQNVSYTATANF